MKKCNKCKEIKELSRFTIDRHNKDGLKASCKECVKIVKRESRRKNRDYYNSYQKEWNRKNPDKYFKSTKGKLLKQKYNISIDEFNLMVINQNNICAICNNPENIVDKTTNKTRALAVDHCHVTGKIRGLLCTACNTGIGFLKFDNGPELLYSAIKYYNKTK